MTIRISGLLLIAALLLSTPAAFCKSMPDTPQARQAAADRYMESGSLQSDIDSMMTNITQQMGATPQITAMLQTMKNNMDFKQMEKVMEDQLVSHFTVDELNAMADFYGSPTGKSIDAKMPQYTTDTFKALTPFIQDAVVKTAQSLQAQQSQPTPAEPPALPADKITPNTPPLPVHP